MTDRDGLAEVKESDDESSVSEVYATIDKEVVDDGKTEIGIPKRSKKKKGKKGKKIIEAMAMKKKMETKAPSPRTIAAKSTFAQIAKELKAKRLAQMARAAAMEKKRKKNRVLRDEEIYTDKDRAAAVNMGTNDIKQSLQIKKKHDKNYDTQVPEDGDPATLLALGSNELRSGNLKIALNFINKALELNPNDKNGLVARSKCYLSLGDPQLALNDAETALGLDKTFVRAIFQKAEALYHLGDFEHSLMYYHRGHRIRPELESFRLGVQKAQEAIENTIGSTSRVKSSRAENFASSGCSSAKADSNRTNKSVSEKSSNGSDAKMISSTSSSEKGNKTMRTRSKSAAPSVKSSLRTFLGDLDTDRLYLENLLKHPDLICSNQEAADLIREQAEEGITFLKSRQEFWRQQKPNSVSNKKIICHENSPGSLLHDKSKVL